MTIQKEQDNQALDVVRNLDIATLQAVNESVTKLPGVHFVLTGSYAIEALTSIRLPHNDLDANIFTSKVLGDLEKVADLLSELPENRLTIYKKTNDRLEYDVVSVGMDPRKLEFQFVNTAPLSNEQQMQFALQNGGIVPTVLASLKISGGRESTFRVKSLPYMIATWIIRISNIALNPKRANKESDLESFKLLLTGKYGPEEVIKAMVNHPQMPKDIDPNLVYTKAMEIVSKA